MTALKHLHQKASKTSMKACIPESILDDPREGLSPEVWDSSSTPPVLTDEAQAKIDALVDWVQQKYEFNDLSVYIIGSICSNSYSSTSDIDIDFCAQIDGISPDDEDAIKDFGWKFKKDVVENYMDKDSDAGKIRQHPIEVHFEPQPWQCFMSVGCYNVLEHKWEVGPDIKDQSFDPVSEYYASAMKQAGKIVDDIRTLVFKIYEDAFACKKSKDGRFKNDMQAQIKSKLDDAAKLYDKMKAVRSNFQKPCKSKEEALKRRNDKKRHVVDAAFKFLDKFGYMQMLKDFTQLKYDVDDGIDASSIDSKILQSVSSNMQLKHLQDSENSQDRQLASMMQEAEQMLNEDASSLVKLSFIAALMAVSSLLPADALTKNLSKAKQAASHMTVNSPEVKKAIAASAEDNQMVGPMSKTNVVNAVAKVLWLEARGADEGTAGRKAVASVIMNRTGNRPEFIIDVIKQPAAFSCLEKYDGGWTDSTYKWYLPYKAISSNASNKAIWDECNQIALQLVNKSFKSTIGDRNAYMNKKKAKPSAVASWGDKCDMAVGTQHFGYLKDRDPKYVVPGTFTPVKKANADKNAKTVVVKAGDTLSKIAKDNKTTIAKLMKLNKDLKNPDTIRIGQKIKIA